MIKSLDDIKKLLRILAGIFEVASYEWEDSKEKISDNATGSLFVPSWVVQRDQPNHQRPILTYRVQVHLVWVCAPDETEVQTRRIRKAVDSLSEFHQILEDFHRNTLLRVPTEKKMIIPINGPQEFGAHTEIAIELWGEENNRWEEVIALW